MKDNFLNYNNYVSVDCVVLGYNEVENKLQVLLIKQKGPAPNSAELFKPQYAIPGDLIKEEESLDEAAARILEDLVNVKGLFLEQFYTFGHPDRVKDPKDADWLSTRRKDPLARVITVAYLALVRIDQINPSAGYFAEQTTWRSIKKIPKLAFDHHQILTHGLKTLRFRVRHRPVGFELLPEKFTLGNLQQLYEALLNEEFDNEGNRKSRKQ